MITEQVEEPSWSIIRSYLAGASQADWHLFAARSNYDANDAAVRWLIDQKELDRATALMIYWNLGAAWHVQFSSEDESSHPATYRLLRLIEQRYIADYYQTGNIWFDPHSSDGGRPDNYPAIPVKRPVPQLMLEAANGSEYVDVASDPDGFDEGLPIDIVEALYALHDEPASQT